MGIICKKRNSFFARTCIFALAAGKRWPGCGAPSGELYRECVFSSRRGQIFTWIFRRPRSSLMPRNSLLVKIVRSDFQLMDVGEYPTPRGLLKELFDITTTLRRSNPARYRVSTSGHLKSHLHITDIISLSVISLTGEASVNARSPPVDRW